MNRLQQILGIYAAVVATSSLCAVLLVVSGISAVRADQPRPLPRGCVQAYAPATVNGKPVLLPVVLCPNTREA